MRWVQRSTYTSPKDLARRDHVHHDPIFSDIRTGAVTEVSVKGGGGFLGTRIFLEKEQEMASEIFLQKKTL